MWSLLFVIDFYFAAVFLLHFTEHGLGKCTDLNQMPLLTKSPSHCVLTKFYYSREKMRMRPVMKRMKMVSLSHMATCQTMKV